MFISKQEKTAMQMRLDFLEGRLAYCLRTIDEMDEKLASMQKTPQSVRLSKKEQARVKRNAYARDYYQRVVKAKKTKETV